MTSELTIDCRKAFEVWIETKRVGKARSEVAREMYEDVLWQAFKAGYESRSEYRDNDNGG